MKANALHSMQVVLGIQAWPEGAAVAVLACPPVERKAELVVHDSTLQSERVETIIGIK